MAGGRGLLTALQDAFQLAGWWVAPWGSRPGFTSCPRGLPSAPCCAPLSDEGPQEMELVKGCSWARVHSAAAHTGEGFSRLCPFRSGWGEWPPVQGDPRLYLGRAAMGQSHLSLLHPCLAMRGPPLPSHTLPLLPGMAFPSSRALAGPRVPQWSWSPDSFLLQPRLTPLGS